LGYDATNFLPAGTRLPAVNEALIDLGYRRLRGRRGDHNYFLEAVKPEHIAAIWAWIDNRNGHMVVRTRTNAWATVADIDRFNATIRQLRRRFGGGFRSDYGTNRYIARSGPDRRGAEAACYKAFSTFENNVATAHMVAMQIVVKPLAPWEQIGQPELDPGPVLNHLLLGFLTSILEDYFKTTFVGLLAHSPNKVAAFKRARALTAEDLASVSQGEVTIEEAIARPMSFQNLDRIVTQYRDIDPGLDLSGPLKRPYRRRRVTLYQSIGDCLERRHAFIHRLEMRYRYTDDVRKRDFDDVSVGVRRVYDYLIGRYSWAPYDM
jgi:hypothetical protein